MFHIKTIKQFFEADFLLFRCIHRIEQSDNLAYPCLTTYVQNIHRPKRFISTPLALKETCSSSNPWTRAISCHPLNILVPKKKKDEIVTCILFFPLFFLLAKVLYTPFSPNKSIERTRLQAKTYTFGSVWSNNIYYILNV